MSRAALLLLAVCAVEVLPVARHRRAAETAAGEWNATSSPAPPPPPPPPAPAPAAARRVFHLTTPPQPNTTSTPKIRRRAKDDRSTSSSSGGGKSKKKGGEDDDGKSKSNSLSMSVSSGSSSSESRSKAKFKKDKHRHDPKSTKERHGWRKWHRACTKCPEEQKKKWRDPTIKWVCGAYQRARRSFKSLCMMRLRNCQDGTMFVLLHNHRCKNDTERESQPHGEHFMYDYKVRLSDDSSSSKSSSSEESSSQSKSSDSSK